MDKDYDRILREAKQLQKKYKQYKDASFMKGSSETEFSKAMDLEFAYLKNELAMVYQQAVSGSLDITVFSYMIHKAKDIKKHKISNHDASVEVGQKLVDTFIKPHLDKK